MRMEILTIKYGFEILIKRDLIIKDTGIKISEPQVTLIYIFINIL